MTVDDLEIPPNATIRQEYVKCGNSDSQNLHGPYLYAYWKEDKKLKKRNVEKNLEDFRLKIAKEIKLNVDNISDYSVEHEWKKLKDRPLFPLEIKRNQNAEKLVSILSLLPPELAIVPKK